MSYFYALFIADTGYNGPNISYNIPKDENHDTSASCLQYLLDRKLAFTSYCQDLSGEKKYFLGAAEVVCNCYSCISCISQPLECLIDAGDNISP